MTEPPEDREAWLAYARAKHQHEAEEKHNRGKGNGDARDVDADEKMHQLRVDIGQLNAESPPESIAAIVERIAELRVDGIVREALLKTIKAQTKTSVTSMRTHIERTKSARRSTPNGQSWRDHLARNSDGDPFSSASNVLIALRRAPEWEGVLALNEFNQRPMLIGKLPWAKE